MRAKERFKRNRHSKGTYAEGFELIKQRMEASPNGCWLWLGGKSSSGYGMIKWNGSMQLVHRIAYQGTHSEIPPTVFVCHKCDTPTCFNPEHLFAGTPDDNIQDAVRKNRIPWGDDKANAKLAKSEVEAIFKLRKCGWPQGRLAAAFKVTQSHISRILSRELWRRLEV